MIRAAGKFVLHTSTVMLGLAAVVVIGLSAAAYRLAQGPVSIKFLVPYVEEALTNEESDYRPKIDDTILTWGGWEKTLEIRIQGVHILNKEQSMVARIPEVILDLSGRALFMGMLAPIKLELIGADAKLVRLADGRVIFGLSSEDSSAARDTSNSVFLNLIKELSGPPDMKRPLGYLQQITISNADLEIFDQPSKIVWRGPHTDLTLSRDQEGIRGDLKTDIRLEDKIWEIDATGNYDPERRVIELNVHFGEFNPAVLAAEYEAFAVFAPITMPMSGSINLELGTEGSTSEAPVISFDISAGPGSLTLPEYYEAPLPVDNLSARGHLDQVMGQVVVEDFFVLTGTAELSAQGLILYGPDGKGAILDVAFSGLPIEEITKYWPPEVKPKSRNWIVENLSKGIIRDGVVKIAVEPEPVRDGKFPKTSLDMQFAFDGMTVRYMRTLPLITDLTAKAHMTTRRLDLTEGVGQVGGLDLTEGKFSILDITIKPPTAEAEFVVKGPSRAAMHLLDSEQLRLLSKIGLKADDMGGQSATRAHLVFPLSDGLNVKDVSFAAAANMESLTMPTQLEGLRVTDGTVQLRANPAGLSAGGDIALNGVPVAMAWTKEFSKLDQIDSRYRLTGVIDDAGREALNIPVAEYLQGPISGVVEIANQGQILVSAAGRLDLTGGILSIPPLHWTKPADVAGTLQFVLRPDADGGFNVDTMDFSIDGFEARGRADFGLGFAVNSVDLERLAYGETDVSVTLARMEDGGFNIAVGGASYDLRFILENEDEIRPEPGKSEAKTPIKIEANLDRMLIGNSQILRNVTALARHTGTLWQEAEVTGIFENNGISKLLKLSLVPGDGVRNLTITSDDAGSVGRVMDIYKNVVGGKLALSAEFNDRQLNHPVTGRLIIDEFRIVNAPLMTKILTIGSLAGIVDLLQGEGIKFERLDSTFTYEDKILEVTDARAFGSAVGFNLEGSLDNKTKFANFGGTVVPAYALNTVLGKVPVLGDLLLGGEGEGVFAISYAVKGPLEKPRITVNPLSALAPGFLRGIVSILTPAPATSPPPESETDVSDTKQIKSDPTLIPMVPSP